MPVRTRDRNVLFEGGLPGRAWEYSGRVAHDLELAKRLTRAGVSTAWQPPLEGGRFVPGTLHACVIEPLHRKLRPGELLVGVHAAHSCGPLPRWLRAVHVTVQVANKAYTVTRRTPFRGGGRDKLQATRYVLCLRQKT